MTGNPSEPYRESPSQTAGPYVHIGCAPRTCGIDGLYATDLGHTMVTDTTPGERITIVGHVYDGGGDVLKDALLEVWQADHEGRYLDAPYDVENTSFTGWGRQIADLETGAFRFETIKPGAVLEEGGSLQAPHISFWIVARGINLGLNTRMYFPDEMEANETCPVLSQVSEELRPTLVARHADGMYAFDIHLQGANETVFLDI